MQKIFLTKNKYKENKASFLSSKIIFIFMVIQALFFNIYVLKLLFYYAWFGLFFDFN